MTPRGSGGDVSYWKLQDAMLGQMIKAEAMLCTSRGAELYTASYFHPNPRAIVVVAHGLAENSGQYNHLVASLWNAQCSVYLYDWRHQSKSAGSLSRAEAAAEDFARVVDQARAREDEKSTFVVAHDEGAAICLAYCATCATALAGVVLFTPSVLPLSATACVQFGAQLRGLLWPGSKMTVVRKGVAQEIPCRQFRLCLRLARDALSKLARVKTPLLILHGAGDSMEERTTCGLVHDQVGSTDKLLTEIDGRTNDVWSDGKQEHQQAMETIIQWLADRA